MMRTFGLNVIFAILMMATAMPGIGAENQQEQDVETVFMNTVRAVSPIHEEVMGVLAAAYTAKCGLPPNVDQMKLIALEDYAFQRAVAIQTIRTAKEKSLAPNLRFSFAEYMQAVAMVMCR